MNPSADLAQRAQQMLADPRRGREEFAPDFQAVTLQGQPVALKQFAGKILVLDFWATWCPPCRASVPELKELVRKYPDRVALLSVSGDKDDAAWQDFVAKKQMTWLQVRDADHHMGKLFQVNAFPTYLVIDGDGILQKRIVGLNPQESVVHKLKALLETIVKPE